MGSTSYTERTGTGHRKSSNKALICFKSAHYYSGIQYPGNMLKPFDLVLECGINVHAQSPHTLSSILFHHRQPQSHPHMFSSTPASYLPRACPMRIPRLKHVKKQMQQTSILTDTGRLFHAPPQRCQSCLLSGLAGGIMEKSETSAVSHRAGTAPAFLQPSGRFP